LSQVIRTADGVGLIMSATNFFRYFTAINSRIFKISFSSCLTLTVNLLRDVFSKLSINIATRVQDVVSAVDCFLFVEGNLLEHVVLTRQSLLFLHQKIVSRRYLVVFVVLNKRTCLLQVITTKVYF